jgi:uncharacterized protein (DUF1778 family)
MKAGRPKVDNPRRTWLNVRLTPSERKLIQKRAALLGLSVSEFIRRMGEEKTA